MNKLLVAFIVLVLAVGVPVIIAYAMDILQTVTKVVIVVYLIVLALFLGYMYRQNKMKDSLGAKALYKKEREEADAFMAKNSRKLWEDRELEKRKALEAKYRGLSRAEREAVNEKERLENIKKLGLKDVKSSSIPR